MSAEELPINAQQLVDATLDELNSLRRIHREYVITARVLAVVVERLLVLTKGTSVTVTDEALAAAPDLRAWRDDPALAVVVTISR